MVLVMTPIIPRLGQIDQQLYFLTEDFIWGLSIFIQFYVIELKIKKFDLGFYWFGRMAGENLIELKFRLSDGTDIGPNKYNPTTTVGSLKEVIVSQWPQDKENGPKTINDIKLINVGKIMENSRTLAESTVLVAEPPGVITMHVVVQRPLSDKKTEKLLADSSKNGCACSIL